MMQLTEGLARQFAKLTLGHVGREFPNALQHVSGGPDDHGRPRDLHPAFYGSFDWHSCVHGWWQLLTLARLFPDSDFATDVRARADDTLTSQNIETERAYFACDLSAGFERPYGWAWLLALHGEAARHDAVWAAALALFARDLAEGVGLYIEKLTYPTRTGTHFNSAFACVLAHEWARDYDADLAAKIETRAQAWFAGDRDCQAWEPGGDEFLSPALMEAELMRCTMTAERFRAWLDAFLPRLEHGEPKTLLMPPVVSDRTDGKIAHLDGLSLSRAWCQRRLAATLGFDHPASAPLSASADRHLKAALPEIAGDYAGEHWLASFALLALLQSERV
ncbi:MAG: DUF2891 domain-containing protein [Pacificimonas sp.]